MLIVTRYFATEQAVIDSLEVKRETMSRELKEFVEEHAGEEGPLEDTLNDEGKVTQTRVRAQLMSNPGPTAGRRARRSETPLSAVSLSSTPSLRRARPSETHRLRWTSGCYRAMARSPRPRSKRWWWRTSGLLASRLQLNVTSCNALAQQLARAR